MKNLLFDLTFFAERPKIRIVVVGTWTQEDYLEEIEPALAGRLRYIEVPMWSEAELRAATAQWERSSASVSLALPYLSEFLELAGGDISLFRTLMTGTINSDPSGNGVSDSYLESFRDTVLRRFRRGLNTRLKALLSEREVYLTYLGTKDGAIFQNNPEFQPLLISAKCANRWTKMEELCYGTFFFLDQSCLSRVASLPHLGVAPTGLETT